MKTWDVKVLYLGNITANLSFIWPAGMPPLEEDFAMSAPYLGFLLQGPGRNILIDTGISEKFIVDGKAWGALPAEGGRNFMLQALEKEGLGPGEIDTVVYTHLHNDHAANCRLFEKARVVFQKDEWLNLMSPLPVQKLRGDYDPAVIEELEGMKKLPVSGDFDLEDGIRLFKTPGHSLGSQSVAVNTRKGVVVFVGDLCLFNFMAFPGTTEITGMDGRSHPIPAAPPALGPAVPHSIIYNFFDYYDSIYKIKAVASRDEPGFIIPGHEPSLIVTGI
ncbi:MAG: N-acyl homoserine lactonase family protein [Proteobacteria bacterium]|nr:N-acyl homoserine lactonase family protein [Pseudomonadota bacterium]